MSGNEKRIRAMYEDPAEEEQRFLKSRSAGMEAHYTKIAAGPLHYPGKPGAGGGVRHRVLRPVLRG